MGLGKAVMLFQEGDPIISLAYQHLPEKISNRAVLVFV